MTAPSVVRIRRLRKTFVEGDKIRLIFERLNLDIQPGESVALLGRSGSGKSTLLNLIGGIDLPDSGEIWVDGQPISTLSELDRTLFRRRRVGFVFQFFNLIPTLTVEENLLLPLQLNGLNQPEQCRQALQLLERVGLDARRNSFPERLSGGEQQRLAVIRALVHRPILLLADEPTGNLDAETGNRVLELLLELHSQAGTTVLMVTHSQEIAARADRVLSLEAGQVSEVTL